MGALFCIALFVGCKKDSQTISTEPVTTPLGVVSEKAYHDALAGLSNEKERNIFSLSFASSQNPNLVPETSQRNNDPLVNALTVKLVDLHKQGYSIVRVADVIGFPYWDRCQFAQAEDGSRKAVILPFAHLNANSASAFIFAMPTSGNDWYVELITRAQIDAALIANSSKPDLPFWVAAMNSVDVKLFNKTNIHYINYLEANPLTDETVTDRACVEIVLQAVRIQLTGAPSDRGLEWRFSVWWCDLLSEGGWDDIGGIGGSGSWGIGTGFGGNYSPGAFGVGNVSAAFQSILDQLNQLDPDDPNYNPNANMGLKRLQWLLDNTGLTAYNIEPFYNAGLLTQLYNYMLANTNDPEAALKVALIADRMWIGEGALNGPTASKLLSIIDKLDLSLSQLEWLMQCQIHINSIENFATQYENEVDSDEYALDHIDEMMGDSDYQAFNIASYGLPNIMWTIGKELAAEKALDIIINLIPGFNKKDEVRDAILAASQGDWLSFTWEVGKIIAGQVPAMKVIDAGVQIKQAWNALDKLNDKIGEIGEAAMERAWNIIKGSPAKFNAICYKYINDIAFPRFGQYFATQNTYNPNFKSAFPELSSQIGEVHHAVPRWVLTRYPHLNITDNMMHSLENLRGIPNNGTLDHPTITNYWEGFYNTNPQASMQEVLNFAKFIDDEFGKLFLPPVR